MRLSVRYMAQLKQAAGVGLEPVEVDEGSTVATLLAHLAARHGALGRLLLSERGDPQPTLLVFLGEEQADPATLLRDGQVVTPLSPIAGG
jgi:molybdopterin converting factor small subunit